VFHAQGGLGNQLFQYANAKAIAERIGGVVAADTSAFAQTNVRSFMLGGLVPGRPFRRITRMPFRDLLLDDRHAWFVHSFTEQCFSYDERVQKIECSCFLVGYFQSERYFPANKDRFLGALRVLMNVSEGSERIADRIRKSSCSVSVHVRRGDYV